MNSFFAFLRGVNISGRNRVAMPELKAALEEAGFTGVATYLNSGNVLLSSEGDAVSVRAAVESVLAARFGISVPAHVIGREELEDILAHAPAWWGAGDKRAYDNLIFILTGDTPADICALAGPPSEGLESIQVYNRVIFWSFDRSRYQQCAWWKSTARAGLAERLTIRTASTLRKVCGLGR